MSDVKLIFHVLKSKILDIKSKFLDIKSKILDIQSKFEDRKSKPQIISLDLDILSRIYCKRLLLKKWYKGLNVESNALNTWKLNILKFIDSRISFYCNNLDLLPPKTKFTFRNLTKGVQEFHRKFV